MGWPARGAEITDLHRLDGYVLPPRGTPGAAHGVEIYLKLLAPQKAFYGAHGVRVSYSSESGENEQDVVDHGEFGVCVLRPRPPPETHCYSLPPGFNKTG
jgi:hypothetical protein